MSIETMKQALEALDWRFSNADAAIEALRQAIKQAEKQTSGKCGCGANLYIGENGTPCSKAPLKREWVGLTDEEIHKIIDDCTPDEAELEELNDFAKAIFAVEAKLKERNT
jgi:hypothetical protein